MLWTGARRLRARAVPISSASMSLQPPAGVPLPPPPPPAQACYRHPHRLTGRACTRCGRPACPDCLVSAPIGSLCPECVREGRPAMAQRLRFWNAGQQGVITKLLVLANVGVFLASAVSGGDALGRTSLLTDGGLYGAAVSSGEWWRIVTSGFLHYGAIHLLMNMYVLWVVGPGLERELGRARFALVYMAALLGGSAGALLVSPNNLTVGASGAIFGLFGAYATGLWARGINPFRTGIGTTLLINLGLTFALSRYISVGGHIGGLVAGAACGWFLLAHPRNRQPSWTYLVPVAIGALAVVVAFGAAGRA